MNWVRSYATQLVALLLVSTTFALSLEPYVAADLRHDLATRFRFQAQRIQVDAFASGPLLQERKVHPSLRRICSWISGTGAGNAFADLDGNGLYDDLVTVDPRIDNVVVCAVGDCARYQPFALDLARDVGPRHISPAGVLPGDFNEDGLADLLIYFWGATPELLIQQPEMAASLSAASFSRVQLIPGSMERWFTHAATQADVDGDGHLDLILGNFFKDGADILNHSGNGTEAVMHDGKSKAMNGGGAKLFLWSGADSQSVKYDDHTLAFEELFGRGWVLAAGAADLDGDQLPEIYLAHDFGPDRLLHNQSERGQPKFVVCEGKRTAFTPKSCVLGRDSFKGMGVSFADLNEDGLLDITVSNIADRWALQESHFVWLSTGDVEQFKRGIAPYRQSSESMGLSRSGWGWDFCSADFDNDGSAELIQATGFAKGHTRKWADLHSLGTSNDKLVHNPQFWPRFRLGDDLSGDNRNPFFVRHGQRYVDVSEQVFGDWSLSNTRGMAVSDVNGDGLLEIATANQWEESVLFINATSTSNAFLGLNLYHSVSGAHPASDAHSARGGLMPAIGTSVVLSTANGKRVAQVDGGSAHAGRSAPFVHFGLGPVRVDQEFIVDVSYRDRNGFQRAQTLSLTPGWHTIVLETFDLELVHAR